MKRIFNLEAALNGKVRTVEVKGENGVAAQPSYYVYNLHKVGNNSYTDTLLGDIGIEPGMMGYTWDIEGKPIDAKGLFLTTAPLNNKYKGFVVTFSLNSRIIRYYTDTTPNLNLPEIPLQIQMEESKKIEIAPLVLNTRHILYYMEYKTYININIFKEHLDMSWTEFMESEYSLK